MHEEERVHTNKEKGLGVFFSSRSKILSTDLVQRALDIEDVELCIGAINWFRSSPKGCNLIGEEGSRTNSRSSPPG